MEIVKRMNRAPCTDTCTQDTLNLSCVTHSHLIVQSYELRVWTGLALCDPVPASPRESVIPIRVIALWSLIVILSLIAVH